MGGFVVTDEQEELLADFDSEEAPKQKQENSTIKQMRETLKQRETRVKELEERTARFESTFLESAGLSEKQAKALRAAGYEASPEGITSFRSEVLGVAEEAPVEAEAADDQQSEEEEAPEPSFAPTATKGQTPAGKREVTSKDFLALLETDPGKADKLLREGRVQRETFNPGGPAF